MSPDFILRIVLILSSPAFFYAEEILSSEALSTLMLSHACHFLPFKY